MVPSPSSFSLTLTHTDSSTYFTHTRTHKHCFGIHSHIQAHHLRFKIHSCSNTSITSFTHARTYTLYLDLSLTRTYIYAYTLSQCLHPQTPPDINFNTNTHTLSISLTHINASSPLPPVWLSSYLSLSLPLALSIFFLVPIGAKEFLLCQQTIQRYLLKISNFSLPAGAGLSQKIFSSCFKCHDEVGLR